MGYMIGDIVCYKGRIWFVDNDDSEFVDVDEPSYLLVPIEFSGDAYDEFFNSKDFDLKSEWVSARELKECN